MKQTYKLSNEAAKNVIGFSQWNTTGFADSTVSALFSILGIYPVNEISDKCTGLLNRLRDIYAEQFADRHVFTVGEVVNALANDLIESV